MRYHRQYYSVSEVKQHFATILKNISVSRAPVVIVQNSIGVAVLMGIAQFHEQQQTLAMLKILALSRRDFQEDQTVSLRDAFVWLRYVR